MRFNQTTYSVSVRRSQQNWVSPSVVCAGVLVAIAGISTARGQDDITQRPYVPKHVTVPSDRLYVVAPDTVFVAGNGVVNPLFTKLDARWEQLEPSVKFKKIMMGSTLSVEGLVSEKSAFGPIGRGNRRPEVDQFVQRFGYEPTYMKIGYDSNPNNKLCKGISVNDSNPIKQIRLDNTAAALT